MPLARFSSPFAPLSLSLEEKEQLSCVADTILGETMATYERFLKQDKGHVDPTTWEQIREREKMRVYLNRCPGGGTGNHNMHLFLTVGTVLGTLHDAMYGAMSSTTNTMRIKSAYTKDTLIDTCVLESIIQPTPDAPFEAMVVRWGLYAVPVYVRLLVNHQDAICIEVMGMRQLSNGERVGFHLMHSVAFDKTPAFKEHDRANTSHCIILRQRSANRVEMYVTSYLEMKETILVGSVVKAAADALLANAKIIDCGRLKKLSWLVQNKGAFAKCETNSGHAPDEGCSVCGSQHRSTRRGMRSACAVCSKYTCKKCRIKQTLHVFAPDGQLLKHEMRFCVPCIKSATDLDAEAVAANEVSGGRQVYSGMTYTMSSSSSSYGGGDSLTNSRRGDSEYSTSAGLLC